MEAITQNILIETDTDVLCLTNYDETRDKSKKDTTQTDNCPGGVNCPDEFVFGC